MFKFGLINILGIIAGLGFIANSALTFIHNEELINNGLETIAIVTEVNSSSRRSGYSVYVKYTVDGVAHNHRLNITYSDRYLGEEVAILYNPNNPKVITPKNRETAIDTAGYLIARSIIGVLVILSSIFWGRSNAKKAKRMFY